MRLRLEHRRFSLPFRQPVRTAHGLWSEREGVLLRLTDGDGRVAHGEAAPIPWFGTGDADGVEAALRSLGEWIDGDEVLASLPAGQPTLGFALRAALAELGGAGPAPAHEHLQVAALLPAGRAALAVLDERLEVGFRVFKWKVGVGQGSDERVLLDDLLARLPDKARLRLDANGAWERREATRWLEIAADRPVEFIEQPVAAGDDDTLFGLAGDYPTPLALDESIVVDADVERWLGRGWPGLFVIKPCLLSDPGAVLAGLEKAGAGVVFSSALETAIGARAALRFAFAWKGAPRALGFGVWPLFANTVADGPTAAPFLRASDLARMNPAAVWAALA